MTIKCGLCGKDIAVVDGLAEGQHVLCPFCGGKFSYSVSRSGISEEDLQIALTVCRKDPELNAYYRNAPQGARLYVALVFYGKVFKDVLDRGAYIAAFKGIGRELKERDLRYLLQYEDDESMREYLSDQLAAQVGRTVNSSQGETKGNRPKLGIIRPVARTMDPDSMNKREWADQEREEYGCVQDEEYGRKIGIGNVCVSCAIICAVAIVGCVVYFARQRNRSCEQMEQMKYPITSELKVDKGHNTEQERQKKKDDSPVPIRTNASSAGSGQSASSGRQETLEAFRGYLEHEKMTLTNIVAESVAAYNELIADQKRLSDALAEIDRENMMRANRAMTNGWIRYEKPEVVMMILKHKVINEMASKYIGADFSALCNSCRTKIKGIMQMHREEEKLLAENRQKYLQAINGDDEQVRKKLEKADTMRMKFNHDIDKGVNERKAQLSSKQDILAQLKSQNPQTNTIMNERLIVEAEILRLQKEIADLEKFAESGKASAAHIAATYAESTARQRADRAVSVRQDEDNAVRMKLEHERDLFAIAMEFEGRSIDRIGAAMQARRDILLTRMTDAKRKLEDVNRTSLNADFLTDVQLKSIREKIGTKIESRLLNNIQ